jgi:oxygen-independent coproporphyrinogen-3 oxidase
MAGVYISFPFCAQKCTYCNFASGVFPRELEVRYLQALRIEVDAHTWQWTPETVYIGGGTPSRLDPEALAQLLERIPGRPWSEATIEAAPGDLTPERAEAWRDSGINRVSFGVQSFVQRELAQTGRRHSAEIVAGEIEMLRAVGLPNISLDLIAGLPHQTAETFAQSLDWIERLDVPHVSVYMLEVDEDSRLGLEILSDGSRYGAGKLPVEEDIVSMYGLAIDRLAKSGLSRYEISNFAKPGFESRHNLKYWRLEPYVGFGADAHSFDGHSRWQNVESAASYVASRESGQNSIEDRTDADVAEERLMVGLRLSSGVELNRHDRQKHQLAIDRFVRDGLLVQNGDILRLTDQGVLYSNEVFQEFVTA